METKLVDVYLNVEIKGADLIAHLRFFNDSSKNIYLDEQTICFDSKTRGDFFIIKDELGEVIDYTGMMVARTINPEYFISLNPGEKAETNINLNEVYEVVKGKKYIIQYSTYHPSYLKEQAFTKLESNKVEVSY